MSELYHFNPYHDRKTGRFTDKNGNLTAAGIVRYKELLARDHSKATQFFAESQAAKELKLPLYDKRRQAGLSDKKKAELEKKMEELAGKVPYPKNIFDI